MLLATEIDIYTYLMEITTEHSITGKFFFYLA